jgi:hypothetical protein
MLELSKEETSDQLRPATALAFEEMSGFQMSERSSEKPLIQIPSKKATSKHAW